MRGFIAVHAGAGFYAKETRADTAILCQEAVISGRKNLFDQSARKTAITVSSTSLSDCAEACAAAVGVLESSALTNAGFGSNLTLAGSVECDAGLMQSSGMHFAGVGSLQTVQHPIGVARHLLKQHVDQSRKDPLNSLVLPMLLTGQGASQFAESVGVPLIENSSLITNRARSDFQIAKDRIEKRGGLGSSLENSLVVDGERKERLDTVGAVALGRDWSTAAAVSSGGLLLKQPGRLSHAPVFGAGAWAEEDEELSVAVSVSGCGEYLMRTHFAENLSQQLLTAARSESCLPMEAASRFFERQFLRAKVNRHAADGRLLAGAIAIVANRELQEAELIWMHNTGSLCLAYSSNNSAKCVMSELRGDQRLLVSGCRINV
uniref:Threonine aspartase 1 n=1 Tax=Plectus sambesii TaxID=2011161 RepID=A0A914USH8_9BILA